MGMPTRGSERLRIAVTGGCALSTGEGLFAFSALDEAADAIAEIAADPDRHAKAARAVAEEYFESDLVLGRLLEEAMR
jgi:hypothetical protein